MTLQEKIDMLKESMSKGEGIKALNYIVEHPREPITTFKVLEKENKNK